MQDGEQDRKAHALQSSSDRTPAETQQPTGQLAAICLHHRNILLFIAVEWIVVGRHREEARAPGTWNRKSSRKRGEEPAAA